MRRPQHLGAILDEMIRRFGWEKRVKEWQALSLWPEVVGAKVAKVTEPLRVRDGILFVKVSSGTWRNELHFYKKRIVAKLNDQIGTELIRDIILQ